jgi:hypothetical protein
MLQPVLPFLREWVRMKPDAKLERKIVRMLGRFLADEQAALRRSRTVARAWILSGSVLWTVAIFGHAQAAGGHLILAVLRQRSRELDAPVPK